MGSPFTWPADARAALKKDIDAFLVALPLGSTCEDARLEELVAGKLLEMGLAQASLQQKLLEWYVKIFRKPPPPPPPLPASSPRVALDIALKLLPVSSPCHMVFAPGNPDSS